MELIIRELIDYLNARTKEYDEGHPTISDKEYDDKFFELIHLEEDTGIIYDDSPTQKIVYNVINELKKVKHNHLMLSLDKTKDINVIKNFLKQNKNYLCMFKMDGLTCSLRYLNGKLVSAETRGNGVEGEDITHNAWVVDNIPKYIDYKDELIVDGEIICPLDTFNELFKTMYKNPRNFAAGSIRLLDSKECAKRNLCFIAWDVIEGFNNITLLSEKLKKLSFLNFSVVPYRYDNDFNWETIDDEIIEAAHHLNYPIDGIVFKFDDIEYGKSLGATDHHFKNAMAFKFYDEIYETKLLDIEWSMGRTGQISPIALFETINIDGTDISRASLSNLSIMKQTLGEKPFKGQIIEISKRNQIIPKIERAKGENGEWI